MSLPQNNKAKVSKIKGESHEIEILKNFSLLLTENKLMSRWGWNPNTYKIIWNNVIKKFVLKHLRKLKQKNKHDAIIKVYPQEYIFTKTDFPSGSNI